MSDKTRTGTENGSRMIYDVGCYELPKKKAQTQAKMFQYIKSKRKGKMCIRDRSDRIYQ